MWIRKYLVWIPMVHALLRNEHKPVVIILTKHGRFGALNGTCKAINSYTMQPTAQMSLANEYNFSRHISGLK